MKRLWIGVVLLLFISAAGWRLGKACAPSGTAAIFSYSQHPDLPRTEFINGRMGVLQPTFARSYLIIAYRYLNGIGLNEREREQARDFYKDRETGEWDNIGNDWAEYWERVRSTVKAVPVPPSRAVTLGKLAYNRENHDFDLNCAEDAFRVAGHTLEARRNQFGLKNPGFLGWVTAQDTVFHNCDSGPAIPPEASADLPRQLRDDRSYQIAAAHFYAGENQDALKRFRSIGDDRASEWSTLSRYLVVRTLLRMNEEEKVKDEAETILADAKLSAIHGMTWNLVERANIQEKNHNYFNELAELLASPGQDDGLREELWNYSALYDKLLPNPNMYDAEKVGNADLTDWISNFQTQQQDGPHCIAQWKRTRSTSWLVAALKTSSLAESEQAGLIAAARALPEDSPAFLTAAYFMNRIAIDAGAFGETRGRLDTLLTNPSLRGLPSSVSLFRGLRLRTSPGLNEFLHFALERPVLITNDLNSAQAPDQDIEPPYDIGDMLLHPEAAAVLNTKIPFAIFQKAASSTTLPLPLRQQALMAAFTRGLMLRQEINGIAAKLGDAIPEVKPFTAAYQRAKTDESRRFAAAFLILHRPEAKPYFSAAFDREEVPGILSRYRDNWWCPQPYLGIAESNEFPGAVATAQAQSELQTIAQVPSAVEYLAAIVFTHQQQAPNDPRIPEALHDIVVPGHLACDIGANQTHSPVLQRAFELLHRRYPNSIWARRTPIWWN